MYLNGYQLLEIFFHVIVHISRTLRWSQGWPKQSDDHRVGQDRNCEEKKMNGYQIHMLTIVLPSTLDCDHSMPAYSMFLPISRQSFQFLFAETLSFCVWVAFHF